MIGIVHQDVIPGRIFRWPAERYELIPDIITFKLRVNIDDDATEMAQPDVFTCAREICPLLIDRAISNSSPHEGLSPSA